MFESPPDRVWPLLADTQRFNEAAGLPKHQVEEIPQEDGSVRYFAHFPFGHFVIHGEEVPASWVHERWFEHGREFRNGPFRRLCARLELTADGSGCRCDYTLTVEPANVFGRLILASGFFERVRGNFTRLADMAREFTRGERCTAYDTPEPKLPAESLARAKELTEQVEASRFGHGLGQRLLALVTTGPESDVASIRPIQLAGQWQVDERKAIEVCLQAARVGLLAMRWNLLCPRCQVGKASVTAMDELPSGAHCPSCNIDYDREFSRNVELVFQPSRSIRAIESGEYCLFGPMSTPHIRVQIALEPGEQRRVEARLLPGRYRVRTLEPGGEIPLEWNGGGFPKIAVDRSAVTLGPQAEPGWLDLSNEGDRRRTVIVEEHVGRRDALTANRAVSLQAFRDLFTEQVLRPGDNVKIDSVTLMFTDLKGSTALYERIGDPEAYALVREHYAIIGRAVRAHNGCVVKTVGDAVMGAFDRPADAFRCGVRLQNDFAIFNTDSTRENVVIKLGFHVGRCIAVTLNNRLDYYGTSANQAARLQDQSLGGDIVLSREFARDPTVAVLLAEFEPVHGEARLKGFDDPLPFLRITADVLARRREQQDSAP